MGGEEMTTKYQETKKEAEQDERGKSRGHAKQIEKRRKNATMVVSEKPD